MKRNVPPAFYAASVLFFVTVFSFNHSFANIFFKKAHPTHTQTTIVAPANVVVATDPSVNTARNVSLGLPAVTSDNVYSVNNNAPAVFPIGVTNVVWTVTDNLGNTATALQTVTVKDTEKPFINKMFEISVVNDPGQCGAVVKLFTPDAYDNSGGPVTLTNNAPSYFPVGSMTITWTATDPYGNSDTSTQVITVIDNEEPTIHTTDVHVNTSPGKKTATVNLGTPVAADNCGVVSVTNDAPAIFPVGTTLVTWTVTDKVGFTGTSVQTVVVTDIEKPVITTPATVTVNNTAGTCGATITLTKPVATDNCGIAGISCDAPAFFPTGTTLVTWTATDNSGNTSQVKQTVIVKDVEAPVISGLPATVTVSCDNTNAVTPTVTDNCSTPVVTYTQTSTRVTDATKTAYYNYTITRIWTAKDASGNTATAKQVITVADKTAPVITVPSNIVINNDLNICGAVVKYTVTATDNCSSPVTLTYSKSSGASFATGSTTVTVTAKDVSGNSSSKSFTVTVIDAQKPSVKAPANISEKVSSSNSTVNVNLGTPVTSDNCSVKTVTNNAPSSYRAGVTTVTWIVTDAAGNVSTATQTVTVTVDAKKRNEITTDISSGITTDNVPADELKIVVAPNPSPDHFTLKLSSRLDLPVNLRVFDAAGRVIDTRPKLGANSTVQIGGNYMPGIYFAELVQGTQRKVVQLAKIR